MPFNRFRTADGTGVDTLLGPEMRSTGEVMGIDADFGTAFAKSQTASYGSLPTKGTVFVSVANGDKRAMVFPIKRLADLGFEIVATEGTAEVLRRNGVAATVVRKYFEGRARRRADHGRADPGRRDRPGDQHPVRVRGGSRVDGYEIRTAAVSADIPCITTVPGARRRGPGHRGARRAATSGCASLQDWARR